MKMYLREKKKWVSEEEYDKFHASKRDKGVCRGRKPHDYVLILPSWGVEWDGKSPYNAELYYETMEEISSLIKEKTDFLKEKGIIVRALFRKESFHYVCSVCKKVRYEHQ